jgi:hypothetical protein
MGSRVQFRIAAFSRCEMYLPAARRVGRVPVASAWPVSPGKLMTEAAGSGKGGSGATDAVVGNGMG